MNNDIFFLEILDYHSSNVRKMFKLFAPSKLKNIMERPGTKQENESNGVEKHDLDHRMNIRTNSFSKLLPAINSPMRHKKNELFFSKKSLWKSRLYLQRNLNIIVEVGENLKHLGKFGV